MTAVRAFSAVRSPWAAPQSGSVSNSMRRIVSSVILVFHGSGYGLSNSTLLKFIAMAAIIAAAASYTTNGDMIPGKTTYRPVRIS